jgi:hypothetical protein
LKKVSQTLQKLLKIFYAAKIKQIKIRNKLKKYKNFDVISKVYKNFLKPKGAKKMRKKLLLLAVLLTCLPVLPDVQCNRILAVAQEETETPVIMTQETTYWTSSSMSNYILTGILFLVGMNVGINLFNCFISTTSKK